MTYEGTFEVHPGAAVVDPDMAGMSTLMECLNKGFSIRGTYCAKSPIQKFPHGAQWLECQTSGSTGRPKTIRRTPSSWQRSFVLSAELFGASSNDHYAVLGSLGHSLSLFAVLEALHVGATLSILSARSPKEQLRAISSRSISVIYATPTQLKQLGMAASAEGARVVPSLKRVLVGGGKFCTSDRARFSVLFPAAEIIDFYGTSETSFVAFSAGSAPRGSVGRPYPAVEVNIEGAKTAGDCGEVLVRSPYLADTYLETEKELVRQDGFVATGEVGYFDANGYLFLRGRADRMVTVSDVNVFPEAIEQTIASLDSVETCAVISTADATRGNRIICFVKPAVQNLDPSFIRRHCRSSLGESHVPKEIRLIPDLPMLPSGKFDLASLEAMSSF
jgi:long-chain acyl-CoA synthetase